MQNNEKRLKQIDISIVSIIVLIFVFIHSIYLLINEKKGILGFESLSEENFAFQALWNRIVGLIIVFVFLVIAVTNLYDLLGRDDVNESEVQNQIWGLISVIFGLLAVLIQVISALNSYLEIKEN